MRDFIATGEFEVVLSHNRFTLIDRSAQPLMDDACERGVAFVNGAPYGGGILAKGPDVQPKYAYRPASDDVTSAVRAMQRACAEHGVSLPAAALQFSLRDPRVAVQPQQVFLPARGQASRGLPVPRMCVPRQAGPEPRATQAGRWAARRAW